MAFSQFDKVPNHYAGSIIQRVKDYRDAEGKRSLDPTKLLIGDVEIVIPRHFGFCFGVERAIHMAFNSLERHPDKRTYLISEIIHSPLVNDDLHQRGIDFIYDADGERRIAEDQIAGDDIVMIPAFGTTLQIEESLQRSGVDTDSDQFREQFDTTCPFVSKVWNRGEQLGKEGYTILIHGKFRHEETQATHSHTMQHTKTLVVLDEEEALQIHDFILQKSSVEEFTAAFGDKWSPGFDPSVDLDRVAVVNQTTMLAEETKQVANLIRQAMVSRFGQQDLEYHFADTNDTLCYATNQNQDATQTLLDSQPDIAIIVGGYNSSNTSHLVEICSTAIPSYLISSESELLSRQQVRHFDIHTKDLLITDDWLPDPPVRVAVTSGASCPDILLNQVIEKIVGFSGYGAAEIEKGIEGLEIVGA